MTTEEYRAAERTRLRKRREDPAFRERERAYSRAYKAKRREDPELVAKDMARRRTPEYKVKQKEYRQRTSTDPEKRQRNIERCRAYRAGNMYSTPRLKRKVIPRVKSEPKKVPTEVRMAWNKGVPGSIIRIKYPTTKALAAGAKRGDFDGTV